MQFSWKLQVVFFHELWVSLDRVPFIYQVFVLLKVCYINLYLIEMIECTLSEQKHWQ